MGADRSGDWRKKILTSGVHLSVRDEHNPGRDCYFPGTPNGSRVQYRSGLINLVCQFLGLEVWGLI
jgi:hypothetical protein